MGLAQNHLSSTSYMCNSTGNASVAVVINNGGLKHSRCFCAFSGPTAAIA